MLRLFKPKIILKDLIPDDYIDIHSHILPGIDDGSQTFADTLFLVSEIKKLGFEQCITTPHIMTNVWENTRGSIESQLKNTITYLEKYDSSVPLKAAAEYLIDSNFATLFQNESLLVLKDNYVLVELSYINAPLQLYDILFDLQVAGYKPVLAHPERYSFYYNNQNEYQKLKHAGCLFQLNLLSTVGYYGIEAAKIAEKLLLKGMIDFVGSDIHHKNHIEGFSRKILLKDAQPLKNAIDQNQFFRL